MQAMSMVVNSANISLSSINSRSSPQIDKEEVCTDDVAPLVEGFQREPALVEVEVSFFPSLSVSSFF